MSNPTVKDWQLWEDPEGLQNNVFADMSFIWDDIFLQLNDPDNIQNPHDYLAKDYKPTNYYFWRYATYEINYPDIGTANRLLRTSLMSNLAEYTKLCMVLRSLYLQYEKLLIGDTMSNINELSYTGLNASGVYTSTNNTGTSTNTFDALTKMINTAQTELYLFLDRMIQPHLRLLYSAN